MDYRIFTQAKPCPFCGEGKDIRIEETTFDSERIPRCHSKEPTTYIVKCYRCGAITQAADSEDEAKQNWQNGIWTELTLLLASPLSSDDPKVWDDLNNAIILQAFKDFKKEVEMRKFDKTTGLTKTERWFLSKNLGRFTTIQGETIIAAGRKQVKYDRWRKDHKCRFCHETTCKHCKSYPWKSFNDNTTCPKEVEDDQRTTHRTLERDQKRL